VARAFTSNRRLGRLLAPAVLVAAVVAVAVSGNGSRRHHLFVTVADATDALAGQEIRAAGRPVGEIASIEPVRRGHALRLDLAIDDAAWPVPSGTRFALRWGGTISYGNRYLALEQGPSAAPPLTDGQTIPAADFTVPVEFDQLIGTFTPEVRSDLKSFLDRGGVTLSAAEPDLRQAIEAAPPALAQAGFVLHDLDADEQALDTLVISTDRVVGAVHAADPGVGRLVSSAATTFDAIGSEAGSLKDTLAAAPPTLIHARATLAHAGRTLGVAGDLLARLAPGVDQVRRLAAPLDGTLARLMSVGPGAVSTLETAHTAAPQLNPLLGKATRLMPELRSVGRQAVTQLQCIRPYTPDIVAFFSNWADWLSYTDGKDRYGLANSETLLPAGHNAETINSGQAAQQFPGLRYGFPRPPGYNAGQPWYLPQCGAGPDALDPSKDPEARTYNPTEQLGAR
jgi:ABC-type transporter Mla subunit MlaD